MTRVQLVSAIATFLLFLGVLELVRRRRFLERYALIWLGSALAMLVLALYTGGLEKVAAAVGIKDPPNALFVVGFAFVLGLLLHFSVAVSRLSDQTKVLAQRVALLEAEKRAGAASEGTPPPDELSAARARPRPTEENGEPELERVREREAERVER